MTTYELFSHLLEIHETLHEHELYKRFREIVSKLFKHGDTTVYELLVRHPSTVDSNNRELLNAILEELRQLPLGDSILKLNSLHSQLSSLADSMPQPASTLVSSLPTLLRKGIDAYESFIMTPNAGTAYKFAVSIRELEEARTRIYSNLYAIYIAFLPQMKVEGNTELSIDFTWTKGYKQFIAKLISIDNLYAEFCSLLQVSQVEYPLRIVRAEYGSLWIRLFGESRVVTLITSLIESAVSYLHRNYTDEGKIEALPKKVSAVEEILKLTEKLEAAGIDTQAVKEHVQKSAVILSQELNTLLMHEPNITINGKNYSVGKDAEDKYLKDSVSLFLTTGDESDKGGGGTTTDAS